VDSGFCVECMVDSDCTQPGYPYCATDVEFLWTYCVQCLVSSDCGDAGPCNGASYQCGSCFDDYDCPPEVPTCIYSVCTDGGF
jgi:hypothetical protein